MGNVELRRELSAIVEDGQPTDAHPRLLEQLNIYIPHSIQVPKQPINEDPVEHYNCVMYALDIFDDPAILNAKAAARRGDASPDSWPARRFIEWLLQLGNLEPIDEEQSRRACLAVYFEAGEWKHMGWIVDHGRVRSKWGTHLVLEHAVEEVPLSYGDEVRHFKSVNRDTALNWFFDYARIRAPNEG